MITYTIKVYDLNFGFRSSDFNESPYYIYRKGWNSFFYVYEIKDYFNLAGYNENFSYPETEELSQYGEAYLKAIDKFNRLLVFA